MRKRIGRTAPTEPENGPTNSPDADELAALRKEKQEREAAAAAEREKELADLRAYKQEQEAKAAKAVKAPARKPEAAPTAAPTAAPAMTTPRAKRRGRGGASRLWFGEEDED
jgi:hypothetical protein